MTKSATLTTSEADDIGPGNCRSTPLSLLGAAQEATAECSDACSEASTSVRGLR